MALQQTVAFTTRNDFPRAVFNSTLPFDDQPKTTRMAGGLHHLVVCATSLVYVSVAETLGNIITKLRFLKTLQLSVATMLHNKFV